MSRPDHTTSTTELDERLLAAAVDRATAGPPGEAPPVAHLVRVAQRARARRRVQVAAAAVVVMGGVGLGTTLVLGPADGPDRPVTVAKAPAPDATSSSSTRPVAYALDPSTLAADGLVDIGPTDGSDLVALGADGVLHVDEGVDLGDVYGRVVPGDGDDRLLWVAASYTVDGGEAWFIGRDGDDPTSVTLPALRPADGGDPFRDWVEQQSADGFLGEVTP